ncbi:YggS family pyridoxal phosphate-dependent enzyme [Chryseobacterium gambrini]|uniref:Pyridoxal phosphate homeostasis protein n=2 Tax=Chryseobacterium TaxID=59732 RepID=A0AAJ1R125_9FLAO|nr:MULTISPECIES: YggS family pyridoxal phosphate-dependent enzyme [Chryseobacterium]MCF2219218.1 YggS family pyridoxal phosphate-dependent enzyme [Chryseobacterium sp. PS-8]MDN4011771.1 YggS family pyridoxal phosphate-dependent enzyme [Chryseobacterium gambrini]MDN4029290.1 YggS family pyridoxal phosphate-dependent enzyme [Chryseobacterium gambrini]QWA39044.1 YggS family pyridoxal phosphate-dependent enzyme [Chryseobacterium sp. ZHDP1]
MSIQENYNHIKSQLPSDVQLVAVSKTHPVSAIQEVYDLGQRVFGENKVQEVTEKYPLLPKDIQWHLIGHLQTNKVKYIAEFVDTIQSVDSEKLIREINKEAVKHNRIIKVLLQVKIAEEESKFGLDINESKDLFEQYLKGEFQNVEITGLMGMATFTDDKDQVKKEFLNLKSLFDELNQLKKLETLSMGMSDDFPIAIECGANSVRVGSAIFGRRDYSQ